MAVLQGIDAVCQRGEFGRGGARFDHQRLTQARLGKTCFWYWVSLVLSSLALKVLYAPAMLRLSTLSVTVKANRQDAAAADVENEIRVAHGGVIDLQLPGHVDASRGLQRLHARLQVRHFGRGQGGLDLQRAQTRVGATCIW